MIRAGFLREKISKTDVEKINGFLCSNCRRQRSLKKIREKINIIPNNILNSLLIIVVSVRNYMERKNTRIKALSLLEHAGKTHLAAKEM